MQNYQLAQINIARLVVPEGDPQVSDFFDNIERINQLAEQSPGYVWRLEDDYEPDPMLLFNLSIWESIEQLAAFAYRTEHVQFLRRRAEWFIPMETPSLALWWVEEGERPDHEESLRRLAHLEEHGPTPEAFTFTEKFAAPSA
ncbi:MAG: DUF3291 domain-containing protein [Pseudomonadota bacterium]